MPGDEKRSGSANRFVQEGGEAYGFVLRKSNNFVDLLDFGIPCEWALTST